MDGGYMDSGLIRKMQSCFVFLLLMYVCLLIIGCDMRAGQYPFQVSDKWQCDTLDFSLCYSTDVNGNKRDYEMLIWESKTIPVNVVFGMGEYCVFPDGSANHDERLFSGIWKYEGDKLVLIIKEDFLFDNQFSALVFSPIITK